MRRKSVRAQNKQAVDKLSKKPMSISPMSAIGGFSARVISPKTFSDFDEISITIVCILFFSAMSYAFFSYRVDLIGYFWALLAVVMAFCLFGQCFIIYKNWKSKRGDETEI